MKKTLLLFLLFFISCNDQKELSTNFNINEIKDGVIYDAKKLLLDVKQMVDAQKEEKKWILKQPGIKD